jgi:hypothetical protein
MHTGELGVRDPHAMAKHSAAPHQAVILVYIKEVLPLRKELSDERDFVAVLRDVGLHIELGIFAPQRGRRLVLGPCA